MEQVICRLGFTTLGLAESYFANDDILVCLEGRRGFPLPYILATTAHLATVTA